MNNHQHPQPRADVQAGSAHTTHRLVSRISGSASVHQRQVSERARCKPYLGSRLVLTALLALLPDVGRGVLVPQVNVPFVNEVEALDTDGFWLVAASGVYYYDHSERRARPLAPATAGHTADEFYCLEPGSTDGTMLAGSPDGLFEVDSVHFRSSSLTT